MLARGAVSAVRCVADTVSTVFMSRSIESLLRSCLDQWVINTVTSPFVTRAVRLSKGHSSVRVLFVSSVGRSQHGYCYVSTLGRPPDSAFIKCLRQFVILQMLIILV